MRDKLIFCFLIGLLATLLIAVVVSASDRRDRNVNPDDHYDVKAERIFEGVIAGKGHIVDGLMYFPLKAGDTAVEVQLGPKEFVQCSTFIFKPGDMVIIVGVPAVLNERRVVLARQVSGMKGTLILRDDDGVRHETAIRSDMMHKVRTISGLCQVP
jgi:hypothetical protein